MTTVLTHSFPHSVNDGTNSKLSTLVTAPTDEALRPPVHRVKRPMGSNLVFPRQSSCTNKIKRVPPQHLGVGV